MEEALSLDDVLLKPADFSLIRSRKDVHTATTLCNNEYKLGLVSSNMTSVYSPELAKEVAKAGGISVVPRFYSIEENIRLFKEGILIKDNGFSIRPWVSIGVSSSEFERAEALYEVGANNIVIDVALGANIQVVEQFDRLREKLGNNVNIVVGNFASSEQIKTFNFHCNSNFKMDLAKVSIGSGSACKTAKVTGCGTPTYTVLRSCVDSGVPILLDGGVKNSGDFAKALALGAVGVMVGKNFAACQESGASTIIRTEKVRNEFNTVDMYYNQEFKLYSGSASYDSYLQQNKIDNYRTAEGDSYYIPVMGTVKELMQQYEAGLRSSMSYLNANNLEEFRNNARFVKVTNHAQQEMGPHGKATN